MISREVIENIIKTGVRAPSGSNSQPWRFEVRGAVVRIIMLPEKDHPVLNFRNRGTLFACGALIENMAIAAGHYGVCTDIRIFPEAGNTNVVADIELEEEKGKEELALFDAIRKRATNRKPYETRKINDAVKEEILGIPAQIGQYDIKIKINEEPGQIATLAEAASGNEIIMFQNKTLHKLFFEELVWTEDEEKEKKSGLYLRTMELKPQAEKALRIIKSWLRLRLLNAVMGVAKKIAADNAKIYAQCGAYGAVFCNDNDSDFIAAGRVVERAWLVATAGGLSFHLQTGINFLFQRISMVNDNVFSEKEEQVIRAYYAKIVNVFEVRDKLIPVIFRIGYDGVPSALSSRKIPEISFIEA